MFKLKRNKKNDIHEMETGRIISAETDFNTVETYKAIRTNIMFSLPKKEYGKVICVTSSAPGEGKTTTCTNLAITFAQTGAKVALVDCDLRKARIHRYLEIKRDEGVSNILCGFSEIENTLIKNVRENLDVLTAGEIPLNPAELLQTQEFDNLIDKLRKEYDYVFIDTPPITVVTDAVIVSGYEDNSFRPEQLISRAEAIAIINRMLVRYANKDGVGTYTNTWSDNNENKWYYYAVIEATNAHEYDRAEDQYNENWN